MTAAQRFEPQGFWLRIERLPQPLAVGEPVAQSEILTELDVMAALRRRLGTVASKAATPDPAIMELEVLFARRH